MRHKTCTSCLWWWDLYDTGERKCYNAKSPYFHREMLKGCKKHEDSVPTRWKNRNNSANNEE